LFPCSEEYQVFKATLCVYIFSINNHDYFGDQHSDLAQNEVGMRWEHGNGRSWFPAARQSGPVQKGTETHCDGANSSGCDLNILNWKNIFLCKHFFL